MFLNNFNFRAKFSLDIEEVYTEISAFWSSIKFSEIKLKASSLNMLPEDKSFYRNFIDGMEILNSFLVDFQEIGNKNVVVDRFREEYSQINTFRKLLESIRSKEVPIKLEEVLELCLKSEEALDSNFAAIIEEIKRNDSEVSQKIARFLANVLRCENLEKRWLALKVAENNLLRNRGFFLKKAAQRVHVREKRRFRRASRRAFDFAGF